VDEPAAAPLPAAAAAVLSSLTDAVHKRLGGLLSVALARFRCGAAPPPHKPGCT
jgi:hypothetical protein